MGFRRADVGWEWEISRGGSGSATGGGVRWDGRRRGDVRELVPRLRQKLPVMVCQYENLACVFQIGKRLFLLYLRVGHSYLCVCALPLVGELAEKGMWVQMVGRPARAMIIVNAMRLNSVRDGQSGYRKATCDPPLPAASWGKAAQGAVGIGEICGKHRQNCTASSGCPSIRSGSSIGGRNCRLQHP